MAPRCHGNRSQCTEKHLVLLSPSASAVGLNLTVEASEGTFCPSANGLVDLRNGLLCLHESSVSGAVLKMKDDVMVAAGYRSPRVWGRLMLHTCL